MVYVRFPPYDRDATVTWVSDSSSSNKPFYLHPVRKFSSFNMLWTNVLVILLFLGKIIVADNLVLLLGTLRTYQRTGCDHDMVTLKCPHGTTISVQLAQYGKVFPDQRLCSQGPTTPAPVSRNVTCLLPQAVQYSFLQTVVEACQKKRQCKFHSSPKTSGGDPCPGVGKYIEVGYKCRPYEFRSKVACENDIVQLTCHPMQRIAIYSASFGRTEYESVQCPQPQGVPEETCLVSYATETVMQICHGKRSCTISADASTFGNPCRPASRMYLKVVYTCVPRKVLKERYEEALLEDETNLTGSNMNTNDYDEVDGDEFGDTIRESAAFSPPPNVDPNSSGSVTEATSTTPQIKDQSAENQEKMYLYLILSITSGLLLVLAIIIARLMIQKYKAVREAKFYSTHNDHTIPHGFGDENSEIEADINLATTSATIPNISSMGSPTYHGSPAPAADIVQFSEIRVERDNISAPRSFNRYGNSQYYFG